MTAFLIVIVGLVCWMHGRLSGAEKERARYQPDEIEDAIAGRSPEHRE